MQELTIVGIESMAGSNVALALEDRFRVAGVAFDSAASLDGFEIATLSRNEPARLQSLLDEQRPDWIVFCPLASTASWQRASETTAAAQALADETRLAAELARWSSEHETHFTMLSSDAIFAGPRMFHSEDSPAEGAGAAADAARGLEAAVADTTALVVRTHAYGWSPRQDSFCEQLWSSAVDRRPVMTDGRRHATPILASDLAELLVAAHAAKLHGVWHIAGAERTSPYRFACELAAATGLPAPPMAQLPAPGAANEEIAQALDRMETSLCSRALRRKLETPLPLLAQGLARFAAQADNGWRDRLRGEAWDHSAAPRFAA